ncbi:MAG: ABC transporter permease [Acidobacteriota bacterium]
MKLLRVAAAVLIRDLRLALSYRLNFLLTAAAGVFSTVLWYYLSAFVSPKAGSVPGGYFGYVVTGTALLGYVHAALHGFSRRLREEQTTGTLEILVSSPAPPWALLVLSSLWEMGARTLEAAFLLAVAGLLGLQVQVAHPWALVPLGILTVTSFAGLGILAASFLLIFQRGEPVTPFVGGLMALLGGVFFPPELLPPSLALLSRLVPLTWAVEGLRGVLLEGKGTGDLGVVFAALGLFTALLLPASFVYFTFALKVARRHGLLTKY